MNRIFLATVAVLGACAVATVEAAIFSPTGPNAPAILFDANDYDASTGVMPNQGSIGSSADTFNPTGQGGVWELVSDKPDKLADAFGAGLASIQYVATDNLSGESLGWNPGGLPTGGEGGTTSFLVGRNIDNGKGRLSMFAYGEWGAWNDFDGAHMWLRNQTEGDASARNKFQLGTDGGSVNSGFDVQNGEITVLAVSIDLDSGTGRFSLVDSGGLQSSEDIGGFGNQNMETVHGAIGGNGDDGKVRYFADWEFGASAIIPAVLNDTDRNDIVNALYGRYALGSGQALIPEPSTIMLIGLGLAGLLGVRRVRR